MLIQMAIVHHNLNWLIFQQTNAIDVNRIEQKIQRLTFFHDHHSSLVPRFINTLVTLTWPSPTTFASFDLLLTPTCYMNLDDVYIVTILAIYRPDKIRRRSYLMTTIYRSIITSKVRDTQRVLYGTRKPNIYLLLYPVGENSNFILIYIGLIR